MSVSEPILLLIDGITEAEVYTVTVLPNERQLHEEALVVTKQEV